MVKNDKGFQAILHIIMILLVVIVLFPILLLIMASMTQESEVILNGYSLWPKNFDFTAYQYIFGEGSIFHSYLVTIFVTLVGTIISLAITTMVSYTLTVPGLPGKRIISFLYPVYHAVFRRPCAKLHDVEHNVSY